jgi:hypothetical protein
MAAAFLQADGWRISRRGAWVALAASLASVTAGGYVWRACAPALNPEERVIELPPAGEPLEHGFHPRGSIDYRVVANATVTGYDSIRVETSDQGGYYHPLKAAQAAAALRNGWRLYFEAKVEEGGLSCNLDFPGLPNRYILNLLRNPGGPDLVRLPVALTPDYQGPVWEIAGTPGQRHRFLLVQEPASGLTRLWIDGVERLAGYRGLNVYRYYRGFEFGAAIFRGTHAAGIVWRARLEIA